VCGLFGCFSRSKPVNEEIIKNGLSSLSHRGPDQKGYWISPDGKVGIGQTRLSINDLSDIKLPLSNTDGSIQVITNAEIYNFAELKKDLELKGYQFKTTCDVEVIPHLYEEYGINFINRLRGEFAFVLWDNKRKALFAVRDRFGIKPLYYAIQGDFIFFSSEIPVLLDLKITNNRWNYETVYDYTHLSLPYSKNLFQGIHEVAPANVLSIKQGERNMQSYWDINYHSDNQFNYEDAIALIRQKLVEATTIRMKADISVGCYLSGGIDSSALLGIASKYSNMQMDAFTIAFGDERVNESDISERTAKHANAKLHTVFVSEDDMVNNFEKVVKQTCFPMPNTAGVARYLLSKFAREKGCKAVLSGEGADEVFLGYFGAMIEASEDNSINTSFKLSESEKQKLLGQLPLNRSDKFFPKALAEFRSSLNHIPSWFTTQGYFNAKHRNILSDSIKEKFSLYNPYVNFVNSLNIQNKLENFDNVQISSYTWIKSFFPNTMLNWIGDRAEMANSIESRQAFLDHELFDLVAKIPTIMKIKGGIEKHLLREAVKPFVTDEIYKRKKFMFQAPPLKIMPQNKLYQFIKSTIIDGIDNIPFYDKQKVFALIGYAKEAKDLPISEKAELSYTLTSLASMVILSEHYKLT